VTLQISLIPKFIKTIKELKTQMDRCNIPITPRKADPTNKNRGQTDINDAAP